MRATRLSEKLNNKRGASILVALVLLLVVTMTSVLVLAAVTANSGRMQKQQAQECAWEYANSVIKVIDYQIKNTDMTAKYPIKESYLENDDDSINEDPLSCIDGTNASEIPTDTLFCADYINDALDKILTTTINPSYDPYTVTPSYNETVNKAYENIDAQVVINGMDFEKKNFSIKGRVQIKNRKDNEILASIKFKIPATVSVETGKTVEWKDAARTETYYGYVIVKWGNLVTY